MFNGICFRPLFLTRFKHFKNSKLFLYTYFFLNYAYYYEGLIYIKLCFNLSKIKILIGR